MSTELQDSGDRLASGPGRAPQMSQVEEQRLRAGRLLSDFKDVPKYQKPVGNYVSLYAGAGGLDIGFALAGFVSLWVGELDPTVLGTRDKACVREADGCPHRR